MFASTASFDFTTADRLERLSKAHAQLNLAHAGKSPFMRAQRTAEQAAGENDHLDSLIRKLAIPGTSTVDLCFSDIEGASARAAASIADWLTYLPVECVQRMVRDGWHWTT